MSEDVYVLKKAVDKATLETLNGRYGEEKQHRLNQAVCDCGGFESLDQAEDWICALESGKEIVNPMSPREKVKWLYDDVAKGKTVDLYYKQYVLDILQEFIIQIAKKHPDVGNWLDGDGS